MRLWDSLEILNGMLAVVEFWMMYFGVAYLSRTYIDTRAKFGGRHGVWRTLKALHRNNKPEIALMVLISALCVRTFALWYLRYLDNRGYGGGFANQGLGNHLFNVVILTTATMIVGVACWIRVISPYDGRKAALIWFIMISTSVLFSVGFALT